MEKPPKQFEQLELSDILSKGDTQKNAVEKLKNSETNAVFTDGLKEKKALEKLGRLDEVSGDKASLKKIRSKNWYRESEEKLESLNYLGSRRKG